jgi:V8-like Glu-specific endopeptidase
MSNDSAIDPIPQSDRLLAALRATPTEDDLNAAFALLPTLRNLREFGRLSDLAELVSRYRHDDATTRKLHAQALIECGRLTVAVQLLENTLRWPSGLEKEYSELQGLRGRANKQLFLDTPGASAAIREAFLRESVAAYRAAFDANPATLHWPGVNLCALTHMAQRLNINIPGPTSEEYAKLVLNSLDTLPESQRDQWWHATKAEAHLALGELPEAETHLGLYISTAGVQPFHIGSTLRQLREVWAIQNSGEAGARLVQILEADLARRPGANYSLNFAHLLAMQSLKSVDSDQLQRLAGPRGMETLRWYRMGLQRAGCVAAVCEVLGLRFGTGFAVSSGDFNIQPANEILLLTNWHVLNSQGFGGFTDFSNVEIVFDAISDTPQRVGVKCVVAESRADTGLDYALLRLSAPVDGLKTLTLTQSMPSRTSKARVYVIGYPLGDALQFSLQDNVILDHECSPDGTPPSPERRRVHYSAATEKGSSGSPVLDERWNCIALHHAGGKRDPQRGEYGIAALNGGLTVIEANEGIWIGSIQKHVSAQNIKLPPPSPAQAREGTAP